MKIKVNKLPKSEIEIEGEIEADLFESYYKKALEILGRNVELPGFRKGKVPESVLVTHIPEMRILEEMAELALSEHYPKILESEKIDAISRPEIGITKLARGNPLGFKIKTATLPEIKLPDYKKSAKNILGKVTDKEKNVEVTDADLENTILDIRKSRASKKHVAENVQEKEVELELPEFNDEYVKGLGPFENVGDFRQKLRENIKLEKEMQAKEKTRLKIIEEIIESSELEVPEILIELELNKILYKMESDISAMGLVFADYLKQMNKTTEDLKKEFRPEGEKKAKLALILNKIAQIEKIMADEAEVAREVAHILEHYKDADPERARAHAENVLTNEKIFQFLETQ